MGVSIARIVGSALAASALLLAPMRVEAEAAARPEVTATLAVTPARGAERSFRPTLTLANIGSVPVTLVKPGDGSDVGWRTPIVTWLVTRNGPSSEVIPQEGRRRCGNMNPLRTGEVFILAPGQRLQLTDWVGEPQFAGPGTYAVALEYQNDPLLKWGSWPGGHDPAELARVIKSTPLQVRSNAVEIVVE